MMDTKTTATGKLPSAIAVGANQETLTGRTHPEPPHPYRTPFARDGARILHSRAFRRLAGKTQVFTQLPAESPSDHFRSRLTHTLEVMQIARTLAARKNIKAIVFQTVIASRSLAERIDALIAWISAEPLPKPLFVGFAAGHAATRKMSVDEAIEKLRAQDVAAFTDPIALVRAAAQAVG